MISRYDIPLWYPAVISRSDILLWHPANDHSLWYPAITSRYDIPLWYPAMTSRYDIHYDIPLWYPSMITRRYPYAGWSTASACIRIPHHPNSTTPKHQHTSNQSNTTHEITQQISRKLLKMDVLTFETCALSNEIIKQVTSSWSIFIQLSRWRKVQ
jgi:hypothetical protein